MKVTSLQRRVFSKVENKNKKKNEEEAEENHACFDLETYIMRALGCIGWLAVLIWISMLPSADGSCRCYVTDKPQFHCYA